VRDTDCTTIVYRFKLHYKSVSDNRVCTVDIVHILCVYGTKCGYFSFSREPTLLEQRRNTV